MADETKLCEVFQKVLENLTSEDLVKFSTHLMQGVVDHYPAIPKSTLQFAIVQANVSQMVKAYGGKDTAEICEIALRIMNHRDLAQSLAGIKGSLYPVVPYEQVLYDGLKNHTVITIQGQVKQNAERFDISLYKHNDIAFHFNPQFNNNGKHVIVRNSQVRYLWGTEEKELSTPFPFTPGKPFELKIFCTDSEFRVEVDKKPLLNFTHRIKEIDQIRKLTVEFDVFLTRVSIDPVPLWMTEQSAYVLNDVLSENMTITISGQVKPNAKVFSINMMKDNDIFFHLKPYFFNDGKETVIVRNSLIGGVWGPQEKDTFSFPFALGKPFLVKIKCTKEKFEVYVDGTFLLDYKHRQFDFTKINKVEIHDDVIAWGVQVQPSSSENPPKIRMSDPVNALEISTSTQEEKDLQAEGYRKVPGNLNTGTGGPDVYLWFKKGNDTPVTRIQFSFRPEMDDSLSSSRFRLINKNINTGTKGDPIYLWYMSATTLYDVPIVDLKVTTNTEAEPALFQSGWECLGCDLNRGTGATPVHLWVKRSNPTYIPDIRGSVEFSEDTALFPAGYFRVDEDTNRGAKPAGSPVFLWYQHTPDSAGVINKIDVSLSPEDEDDLTKQGFIKVNTNLNKGSSGSPVYLWYKRGQTSTIKYITVLVGDDARKVYTAANCNVVVKNLNNGNGGTPLYIAYI